MSRRRLRVHYSDDDEDDQPPPPRQQPQPNQILDIDIDFDSVTLNSPNPTNPNLNPDDVEFTHVPDNLMMDRSDCPVTGYLKRMGLGLRREWVDECVRGLEGSVSGFGGLDVGGRAKLCFQRFLVSDMNRCGAGVLPGNVSGLHLVDLAGPFVLQVDEIVNLSCPLKGRYQAANPGLKRCLKLSMTDGVQRVFGMEYRPIKDLEVLAPAGLKIVLRNVHVRRGILMLVPEVVEILGGQVEDLEAARQRLVQEVNKPPRGKRTRNGVVPPLATRATNAAWPPNGLSSPGPTNVPTSQTPAPPRVSEPARTPGTFTHERNTQGFSGPVNKANLQPNISTPIVNNRRVNIEPTPSSGVSNNRDNFDSNISPPVGSNRRANLKPNLSSGVENNMDNFNSNISPPVGRNRRDNLESNLSSGVENNRDNFDSNISPPVGRTRSANLEPNLSSVVESSRDNFDSNASSTVGSRRASVESNFSSTAGISRDKFESNVSSTIASFETNVSSNVRNSWASVEPNLSYNEITEEHHMTNEVDHPTMLSGYTEVPFTYIASLSAKFATEKDRVSYVQGTIKCFLTGVKGFQFKQREKYELYAYVDDGSLISEILIDHNKKVGHSPQEVTAALYSSDTKGASEMKEKMKGFQYFLVNFEGTMLVQISEASPFPIAMEMNQGCSTSDAWLLLRRLQSFNAHQPQQHPSIEPIDLSP